MEAVVYARFSNLEQAAGGSKKRQLDAAIKMCSENGWEMSPDRTFVEEGKSAFSGANRAKGSWLYDFERESEIGLHRGRVLVIEAVDRVSRQGYDPALAFMNSLLSAGVTIATTINTRIYPAYQKVEMMQVMELILHAELAAKESQNKSIRVRAEFEKKRLAAAAGDKTPMTRRTPSWIGVADGQHHIIEERANVVREIYRLAADGAGTTLIAKLLNERGIPTWLGKETGWHESYIYRLLNVRTVLGEYHSPKHNERILDYYPAIIDAETYNRAAAARQRRANKGAGRWSEKHTNLFSGLTRCAVCGGSMTVKPSRAAGRTEYRTVAGSH